MIELPNNDLVLGAKMVSPQKLSKKKEKKTTTSSEIPVSGIQVRICCSIYCSYKSIILTVVDLLMSKQRCRCYVHDLGSGTQLLVAKPAYLSD